MLMLALAVAMIVVDTGALLYAKRQQQAATDAAALGAVRQLDNPQAAAEAIFSLNDYATENVQARGIYYVSDASRAPAERYFEIGETASDGTLVSAANINAVRVRQLTDSPTYFARLFGFGDMTQIETVAVAALSKYVAVEIATRTASFDSQRSALTNQLLGGLLGSTLNLSLIDYNALADTNIGALAFLDALAPKAGLEVGSDTYGDLLGTTVKAGDILDAAIDVLNGETASGNPSVAKLALQTALGPVSNASVPVNQLLDATPFVSRTIGSVQSAFGNDIPYNVFNLLSGTAMILGEGKAVGFDTDVNLGALASVTGTIRVGAPVAHMKVDKVGDSIRTSQIEIQLTAKVLTIPLFGNLVSVPVYINAAEGLATVSEIPCTSEAMVKFLATTGAVGARIGTSTSDGADLNLLVASATIGGTTQVASNGPVTISFSETDIETEKSRGTSSNITLLRGLGSSLQLKKVSLLGIIPIPGLSGLVSTLLSTIGSSLSFLDPVLDAVLDILGVRIGEVDLTVRNPDNANNPRCGAPVLVG